MKRKNNFLILFFITLFSCANIYCMRTQKIKIQSLDFRNLNAMQTFILKLVAHKNEATKNFDKNVDSSNAEIRGNAYWEDIALRKSPVSLKVATNEQSVSDILSNIPNNETIKAKLKNPTPNGILERTLLEFINHYDANYQTDNAIFLLEQFPELRTKILYDNRYEDLYFDSNLIIRLRSKKFYCHAAPVDEQKPETQITQKKPVKIKENKKRKRSSKHNMLNQLEEKPRKKRKKLKTSIPK